VPAHDQLVSHTGQLRPIVYLDADDQCVGRWIGVAGEDAEGVGPGVLRPSDPEQGPVGNAGERRWLHKAVLLHRSVANGRRERQDHRRPGVHHDIERVRPI